MMADKTQNNNCESQDYYLQPIYSGVYTKMTPAQNTEHCYSSLNIDRNKQKQISERLKTFVNRKFSVFTLGAYALMGLIVGCLTSGFIVYHLTRTSDTCGTAERKQLTGVGSTVAVSTAKTSIHTWSETTLETTVPSSWTMIDIEITPYSDLNGRVFKIACVDNGKFWHYDASWNNDFVSALWQPDDIYVRFKFIQQSDGTYKIKSVGGRAYIFDGYGVKQSEIDVLNGKPHRDDDHARFSVTIETEGFYRIQTKATGRFVRIDENLYVSSKKNIKDNRSLYTFVEKK